MAKVNKKDIDLDKTLVEVVFILKGFRQKVVVNTTATEAMEFVDVLNENRFKTLSRRQKEMMENRYYTFNDYMKKATVTISLSDVKMFEIPFFMDAGDNYDLKILSLVR